jgi:hypothetical protein
MNEKQLRWLEEAVEVETAVEVAEQFKPFDVATAVAEEGFLWAMLCSEQAYYQEWLESHPW